MAEDPTPAEPAAATAAATTADLEARVRAAIRAWRDEHIANGPIARATACWNQLDAALASLAASISKEI